MEVVFEQKQTIRTFKNNIGINRFVISPKPNFLKWSGLTTWFNYGKKIGKKNEKFGLSHVAHNIQIHYYNY